MQNSAKRLFKVVAISKSSNQSQQRYFILVYAPVMYICDIAMIILLSRNIHFIYKNYIFKTLLTIVCNKLNQKKRYSLIS